MELASVVPWVVPQDIERMRVAETDPHWICWHPQFDRRVPAAKDLPRLKDDKVNVLMDAAGRYQRGKTGVHQCHLLQGPKVSANPDIHATDIKNSIA